MQGAIVLGRCELDKRLDALTAPYGVEGAVYVLQWVDVVRVKPDPGVKAAVANHVDHLLMGLAFIIPTGVDCECGLCPVP